MTVLVTGGTGTLGRAVVPALLRDGHAVRVLSRRPRALSGVEWAEADLATGEGLPKAVAGIDTVVHLASAPYRGPYTTRVDVQGTARLAAAARSAEVRHLLFASIIGVDVVPWGYFRQKLSAERSIAGAGVRWSVLRFTQFHPFLDRALRGVGRFPLAFIDPGITAQPVDPADAAERLLRRVQQGPSNTIEEFAGPETLTGGELLDQWLGAMGRTPRVRTISVPGQLGRVFRDGGLTTDAEPTGSITWAQYLTTRYRDGGSATATDQTPPNRAPADQAATDGLGTTRTRTRLLDPRKKRKAVLWFERHVQNPLVRAALDRGMSLPMFAVLQTTGRRTGRARQTQVINGLDGDTFWIVSEHGRRSAYVRNLEEDPRVRVRVATGWRSGTATVLDDDDPIARATWMTTLGRWHKADALVTRMLGTEPLTVRIDLEPMDQPATPTDQVHPADHTAPTERDSRSNRADQAWEADG